MSRDDVARTLGDDTAMDDPNYFKELWSPLIKQGFI